MVRQLTRNREKKSSHRKLHDNEKEAKATNSLMQRDNPSKRAETRQIQQLKRVRQHARAQHPRMRKKTKQKATKAAKT